MNILKFPICVIKGHDINPNETIKNCRDCNFYIYPSQNKTIVGGDQE